MHLTILGFQSPYPGPSGATPGYLIQTDTTNLLLDCGSGVLAQLTRYLPVYDLDALLLSHYHHDHVADVGVLQYGLMVHQLFGQRDKDRPLPIYAPAEPAEKAAELVYREATRFYPIEEGSTREIGDMRLSFLRTDHGDGDPCYAMKIESQGKSIVYGADSGPGTQWDGFAKGTDLFICEGTYLERNRPATPNGHLSVKQAAEWAEKLQCRSLLITHLFYQYEEEEVRREASVFKSGACHIAKIGLRLEV
ncbi:MBL fold metallo-hydrolase [Brevibacillus ruminantium]|uniref:MBL fold metallo-hydrolase n=2 Tax=Brevibacillus ruminantium TaxID=2950604 RepID=A0ABY4WNH3_9BACL|nr:MBL fold metallo-hydrolase [Brevibacillus ruminantium]